MNKKIGQISSLMNVVSVFSFAVCMLLGSNFGSYLSSMFIAFSFLSMLCAYAYFSNDTAKVAGYVAVGFASVYVTIIILVYFAQLTCVRLDILTQQASKLIDFQQFGLFFSYDLLGYSMMALATFFIGLTIQTETKADKWLKMLLLIHGAFFFFCLICPMLDLFKADSPAWIGVVVLEFWCVYFIPIGMLSFLHFCKREDSITM